jgi:hypothetical protein
MRTAAVPMVVVFDPARRRAMRRLLVATPASMLASRADAQAAASPSASLPASAAAILRVDLGDGRVLALTRDDLERLPAEAAQATLRERAPFAVQGVSVTTLLRVAGLDLGASLGSGPVVGKALVARAADGYVAVFGLADADPHFGHAPLMVVWTRDEGRALSAREGPFMLVHTGESRPGRWVRQLQSLEVRDLR